MGLYNKIEKNKLNAKSISKSKSIEPDECLFYDNIDTELDVMLDLIKQNEKLTLDDLSKRLNVPYKEIENWVMKLTDSNLVDLNYPLFGRAYIKYIGKTKIKSKPKHTLLKIIISMILLVFVGLTAYIIYMW